MPVTNPQIVTIPGGTATSSSKTTLSNATPLRTGYDFMGWCSTTTTSDASLNQTCSGTTYAAGAEYGIDQTADGGNIILRAIWENHTYDVTLDRNCSTTATGSTSTTVNYKATTLGAITVPTCSNATGTRIVSGFTAPNDATVIFASTGNCTAANNCTSTNATTYTFKGWYKQAAATDRVASNAAIPALQASVSGYTDENSQWVKTSATTLYAGWTETAGAYSSITLPTITKTGYTCVWNDGTNNYNSGSAIVPGTDLTLAAVCTPNPYTITVTAGVGVSALTASGWTGTGTATISKTFYMDDVVDLSAITPTRKTGYTGTAYEKTDTYGTLSGSNYTVGAGAGAITLNASGLTAPTCAISGGTRKVYNYQDTTLTATDVSANYDSGVTITYSFGYTEEGDGELGNWSSAQSGNTLTIAKDAYRGSREYGVNIVVTDGTFSNSCTSGSGNGARTTMGLINSRIDFDANGGTLSGTSPLYASYNLGGYYYRTASSSTSWHDILTYDGVNYYPGRYAYTTSTGTTPANIPTATSNQTGYKFDGWYTAASGGDKVIGEETVYYNNKGQAILYTVAGWSSRSNETHNNLPYTFRYWQKTGTNLGDNVAENRLYAHYAPKQYTIALNKNGATNSPSSTGYVRYDATQFAGAIATLPTRSYTLDGFTLDSSISDATVTYQSSGNCTSASACTSTYDFDGWYQEAAATHKIASNAATPALQASTAYTDANSKWTNDGNVTLYAGWDTTNASVTLPTIAKTGYECGWTDGTNNYNSGGSIIPSASLSLTGYCEQHIYLQDVSDADLDGFMPNVGDTKVLYDKRDENPYTIAKLADKNYWFLDNLAIDLVNTPTDVLTGKTNASNYSIETLKSGGGTYSDNYAEAGVTNGFNRSYVAPVIYMNNKDNAATGAISGSKGQNKVGGYYNYCAASAGSYCYSDSYMNYGSDYGDATQDICPTGWRMPVGRENGEYANLYSNYANDAAFLRETSIVTSGMLDNNSTAISGGYYTTSSIHGSWYTDRLQTDSSSNVTFSTYGERYILQSVRCVRKHYMQSTSSSALGTLTDNVNKVAYLTDVRAFRTYAVGKLADDNYWMLDDLALDLRRVSLNTLKGQTNASDASLTSLMSGGGTTSDPYATQGFATGVNIESYSRGVQTVDRIADNSGYGRIGIYYNFCAASAGSYCNGNGTSAGTSSGDATEDLCPLNWEIPDDSVYASLYNYYSDKETLAEDWRVSMSGYVDPGLGIVSDVGGHGNYWGRHRLYDGIMTSLFYDDNPWSFNLVMRDRDEGLAIRCVKK